MTNAPKEKLISIAEKTGFEFVTYEKKPVKTDSEFFRKLLSDNNIKAEDCIYLDHDNSNLQSASQIGIH